MKKSLTADRRNKIAQLLMKEGSIKVGDLSKDFGVSTETIRKDIIYLEEEGIATKSHGGAIAKSDFVERPLNVKESQQADAKAEIALSALSLIHPGSVVILDTGSTTNAIARQLVLLEGLTIFTNSVTTAGLLAESDNGVYLFGGLIRKSSKATVGDWALSSLGSIHADIAFLGSDGFSGLNGPSTLSYAEAEFKKCVVARSERTYTVADSSKLRSAGLFTYADWQDITGLITSGDAEAAQLEVLAEKTKIILAG